MQYTVRRVPRALDQAIRSRARSAGKSLNDVAIEALAEGLGLGSRLGARRAIDDVVGTWVEDPAIDAALAEQDRIDDDLWA